MEITVVIPARNAAAYLSTTLESIASQTLTPGEVIVVDDGSTDGTGQLAEQHGARVIATSGTGAAAALNRGIATAKTELIAHFDADDVMLPNKLADQYACFAQASSPPLALVSSDLRMFDGNRDDERTFLQRAMRHLSPSLRETMSDNPISMTEAGFHRWAPAESARYLAHAHLIDVKGLYRRSAWEAVGGFNENYRCAYDMDFVWRVSRRFDIGLIPRVLFRGRRHLSNLSGDPTLVARECSTLFRQMLREPLTPEGKSVLRCRLRRELLDIAYIHRKNHHWASSARFYLQAVVA